MDKYGMSRSDNRTGFILKRKAAFHDRYTYRFVVKGATHDLHLVSNLSCLRMTTWMNRSGMHKPGYPVNKQSGKHTKDP